MKQSELLVIKNEIYLGEFSKKNKKDLLSVLVRMG